MRHATASLLRHSFARHTVNQQRSFVSRRFASSTSESTQKRAQDALSTAGKFLERTKQFLEPVGEKAGKLLGSYRQPLFYNFAVAREVIKQIYVKEGLQPPSVKTIRTAYSELWNQIRSPGYVRKIIENGEFGRVGVYGLQAYGIFKIGEIVGRRSLTGYPLD